MTEIYLIKKNDDGVVYFHYKWLGKKRNETFAYNLGLQPGETEFYICSVVNEDIAREAVKELCEYARSVYFDYSQHKNETEAKILEKYNPVKQYA